MQSSSIRILLVEDNPGDARLIRELLSEARSSRYEVQNTSSLAQAREALSREGFDVILLDLELPDSHGLDTVIRMQEGNPGVPIIVLTGLNDEDLAFRAVQVRVQDYLIKGQVDRHLLAKSIRYAMERQTASAELTRAIEKISASEENLRHVLTTSADGIMIVDWDGIVLFANPVAETMMGLPAGTLKGRLFEYPLTADTTMEVSLASDLVVEMRVAETRWEGKPAFLASLRDITERKRVEEERKELNAQLQEANTRLEKLASVDPLTDLLNRRGLERILWSEINRSQRSGAPIMAILLDCDDFKRVNDKLGHAVGDVVLKEIARRLERSVRPSDHISRIGGDEFLVLLPETRFAEALQVAERVRLAIADTTLQVSSDVIRITASMGVSAIPYSVSSIEEILANAHAALKESKDSGGNRVSGSGAPAWADERARMGIQDVLRRGGGFRAVSQKILRLEDEVVTGYELLTRGPPGPFEMPNDFFRISIEHDILTAVDLSCLKTCLEAAATLDHNTRLHVNLFPSTILGTPPNRLLAMLETDRARSEFCLEMSEQQFIGDPASLKEHVTALKKEGISFAIDDVGFGRSSLEAWILLEPDVVKLDHRLLHEVWTEPAKEGPVRRLMKVADTLGTELVAEGIETRSELEVLKDLGIRYGQGFLWGKPS